MPTINVPQQKKKVRRPPDLGGYSRGHLFFLFADTNTNLDADADANGTKTLVQ